MTRLAVWKALACFALVVLATWNLSSWPTTWFDEGSHLMVPKTLVQYGVYADRDDAGFRYFGPTLGVGPTVLLPIAVVFKVFGIGLLQGRAVMAIYLVLAGLAFYLLARRLTGEVTALAAATLFVTSSGVGTLEFGRQVLGEVPSMFFLCLGMASLISNDGSAVTQPRRLMLAGVLLGMAAVTKYVLLGVVGLGLALAWLTGWRRGHGPLRTFLIPAVVAGGVFAAWQVCLLGYLGPSSFSSNFRLLREVTEGSALAFSPDRMTEAVKTLLDPSMLLGAAVPGVVYGVIRSVRPDNSTHGWRLVMSFTIVALSWFVVASIGWRRYSYHGVALVCIPVAAFLLEVLGSTVSQFRDDLKWVGFSWLTVMVCLSLLTVVPQIARPERSYAETMAAVLNREVPKAGLIATWEHEMTFLTDHRYRVPPEGTLGVAVAHVWAKGHSPASNFDFMSVDPDYVLNGPFARGVGLFPEGQLFTNFELAERHGPYVLFRRKDQGREASSASVPRRLQTENR